MTCRVKAGCTRMNRLEQKLNLKLVSAVYILIVIKNVWAFM